MKRLSAKYRSLMGSDMNRELEPIYANANCVNCPSDWFFPPAETKGRMSIKPGSNLHCALVTCNECKVKQKCFDFANAHGCMGVWGGRIFTERNISEINRYGEVT